MGVSSSLCLFKMPKRQAKTQNKGPKGVQKSTQPKKKDLPIFRNNMTRPKRVFGIGGAIRPKTDLTRFVKWPKYIRLQRQRAILLKRLKVPPMINQFSRTADRNTAQA